MHSPPTRPATLFSPHALDRPRRRGATDFSRGAHSNVGGGYPERGLSDGARSTGCSRQFQGGRACRSARPLIAPSHRQEPRSISRAMDAVTFPFKDTPGRARAFPHWRDNRANSCEIAWTSSPRCCLGARGHAIQNRRRPMRMDRRSSRGKLPATRGASCEIPSARTRPLSWAGYPRTPADRRYLPAGNSAYAPLSIWRWIASTSRPTRCSGAA